MTPESAHYRKETDFEDSRFSKSKTLKSRPSIKGCNKMMYYYSKSYTGNVLEMPSHRCGTKDMILCEDCI